MEFMLRDNILHLVELQAEITTTDMFFFGDPDQTGAHELAMHCVVSTIRSGFFPGVSAPLCLRMKDCCGWHIYSHHHFTPCALPAGDSYVEVAQFSSLSYK